MLSAAKRSRRLVLSWLHYVSFNPKQYWTSTGRTYMAKYHTGQARNEEIVLKALSEATFDSLIEIGCGYGRYLKCIAESFPAAKLAGVDISPTNISNARFFLAEHPEIDLREADAICLPYQDRSFEVCFTYGCMIHVPPRSLRSFFREICRVTKQKGLFLESAAASRRRWFEPPDPHYHAHDYEQLFRDSGKAYVVLAELSAETRERLYLVDMSHHQILGERWEVENK